MAEAAKQIKRVGLEKHLYDEAGSLALGQQRILEIARALCCDPTLLLLDEPAAGLRYQEKQQLAELLRRLKGEGMPSLRGRRTGVGQSLANDGHVVATLVSDTFAKK